MVIKPGSRAWPSRNKSNDVKAGARVDYGEKFEKDGQMCRNLVLQANKDANNQELKRLAAADSHKTLARITVPIDDPPDEDGMLVMFRECIKGT